MILDAFSKDLILQNLSTDLQNHWSCFDHISILEVTDLTNTMHVCSWSINLPLISIDRWDYSRYQDLEYITEITKLSKILKIFSSMWFLSDLRDYFFSKTWYRPSTSEILPWFSWTFNFFDLSRSWTYHQHHLACQHHGQIITDYHWSEQDPGKIFRIIDASLLLNESSRSLILPRTWPDLWNYWPYQKVRQICNITHLSMHRPNH